MTLMNTKRRSKTGATRLSKDIDPVGGVLCARVRELRRKKAWTLEEMSAACGVSRSMLSEIERGRANPTLAVAYRIALAFGMSLGDLVEIPDSVRRIDVIRADDQTYHFRSDRNCRIRTLSPLPLEKAVEFYEVVLRPGGALTSAPHFKGARELMTVQRGTVRVCSGEEMAELKVGDSAHYPADVAHSIKNLGQDDAIVYIVATYLQD
jgi:transcriptional regulator with XRE-family HTH domain